MSPAAKSSHTPGPWEFLEDGATEEQGNAGYPLTITSSRRDDLAKIYSSDDATVAIPRHVAIANARLIAAAPELLDAAKFAWAAMNSDEGRRRASDALLAAIAKAAP